MPFKAHLTEPNMLVYEPADPQHWDDGLAIERHNKMMEHLKQIKLTAASKIISKYMDEMIDMKQRDDAFRKWYDERTGTKSESFAFDVWCAAWEMAKKPKECDCIDKKRCELNDKCMKVA